MRLKFQNITFGYEDATEPLFEELTLHFSPGWTGVVGANGSGKTTLLDLACDVLTPQSGHVDLDGRVVHCSQRIDDPPSYLSTFVQATDREALRLIGILEIEPDWRHRWLTLSQGERKRAQIATALWRSPDILCIDEPTNHVDEAARRLIFDALGLFSGIGLLVSHDRALLDGLCQSTVFITPPQVTLRPGRYTDAAKEVVREQKSAIRKRKAAKQSLSRLEKEHRNRRQSAAKADKKRSKKGINPNDHDAKERIGRARVSGKDGQAGRLSSQLNGRLQKMQQTLDTLKTEKVYQTGIWLPGSHSKRDHLFALPQGMLPLGEERRLAYPTLRMAPRDRIGITGPNGAGKSTLVTHLLSQMNVSQSAVVYLPQEIIFDESKRIIAQVKALSSSELGQVMTIVNRLGTRPARLLETTCPSPGEIRKILLALGIISAPHIIIMDEPTNHLDLVAVTCLETALEECPCGLLLVSHDVAFLEHTTKIRWDIRDDELSIIHGWN